MFEFSGEDVGKEAYLGMIHQLLFVFYKMLFHFCSYEPNECGR